MGHYQNSFYVIIMWDSGFDQGGSSRYLLRDVIGFGSGTASPVGFAMCASALYRTIADYSAMHISETALAVPYNMCKTKSHVGKPVHTKAAQTLNPKPRFEHFRPRAYSS